MVKKLIRKITKPITDIYKNVKCGVKIITNIHRCFLYYVLDIIGYTLYLPFKLIFWITFTQFVEKRIWEGVRMIDDVIFGMTGYFAFQYSDSIMNRCYRCSNKTRKGKKNRWLDRYLDDMNNKEFKFTFFDVMLMVLGIAFSMYSLYYYVTYDTVESVSGINSNILKYFLFGGLIIVFFLAILYATA